MQVAKGIGRVWSKITELGSMIFSINNITVAGELSKSPGLTLVVDVSIFGKEVKWSLRIGSHQPVDTTGVRQEALKDAKEIISKEEPGSKVLLQIPKEEDDVWLVTHALTNALRTYKAARRTLCKQHGRRGPTLEACLQSVGEVNEKNWIMCSDKGECEVNEAAMEALQESSKGTEGGPSAENSGESLNDEALEEALSGTR